MTLELEPYLQQRDDWPSRGRHILAQYDRQTVVVYQAYRPSIGRFAADHGYFGGDFSLGRMSWIKPNFLWMMYRSGWGQKQGQEVVLAVRLQRKAFDEILARAVPSSFVWFVEIEEISEQVRTQHEILTGQDLEALKTPRERVYPVRDEQVATRLGLDAISLPVG